MNPLYYVSRFCGMVIKTTKLVWTIAVYSVKAVLAVNLIILFGLLVAHYFFGYNI